MSDKATANTTNRRPFRLILLSVALGLCIILLNIDHSHLLNSALLTSKPSTNTLTENQDRPIANFIQLESFAFNEHGQLDAQLKSPKVIQFESENQHISQPHFYSYSYKENNTKEVWHISAQQAAFEYLSQSSVLEGNVVGTATNITSNTSILEFSTPVLHINHTNETAYSDSNILIQAPGGQTRSDSLSLELDSRTVTLRNKVRSHYAPTQ